jgi:hypothetical protein
MYYAVLLCHVTVITFTGQFCIVSVDFAFSLNSCVAFLLSFFNIFILLMLFISTTTFGIFTSLILFNFLIQGPLTLYIIFISVIFHPFFFVIRDYIYIYIMLLQTFFYYLIFYFISFLFIFLSIHERN